MAKIFFKDIPLNMKAFVEEFIGLPDIKQELADFESHSRSPDENIEATYEASGNGCHLFYLGYGDYWGLRMPNGDWHRAAIGYDDAHIQMVLERDGYKEALRAKINCFNEVKSVFIKSLAS